MDILNFLKGEIDIDVSMTYAKNIEAICKPLYKQLKITYFQQIRLLENDDSFTLSTNSAVLEEKVSSPYYLQRNAKLY